MAHVPTPLEAAFNTSGVPAATVVAFAQASGVLTVEGLYTFSVEDGPKSIINSYHGTLPNTAAGRQRRVGAAVEANLKALIWLVHDKVKWGQQYDPAEWTPATVNSVLNRMRLAANAKDQAAKEPEYEKIKTGFGYETWVSKFESDVASQLSSDGITSMAYLLRRANAPPLPPTATYQEMRIRTAPHTGAAFDIDNARLYRTLEQVTIEDNGAYQWVRPYQPTKHGVNAWTDIINHYEGNAQGQIRVSQAERNIAPDGLKWESEYHGMKFDAYCAQLRKAYLTLENNGINHPVRSRIFRLVNGMKVDNNMQLQIAVSKCKQDFVTKVDGFEEAMRHMYLVVTIEQPPKAKTGFHRKSKISKTKLHGHGGRFGGRGRGRGRGGRGRGGRGGGGRGYYDAGNRDEVINGVRVTNIWKQNFGDKWDLVKDYVNAERNKANGKANEQPPGNDRSAKSMNSDREDKEEAKQEHDDNKGAQNGSAFMKKQGRGTYRG